MPRNMSYILLGTGLTLAALVGCSHTPTYNEMRPDPSRIVVGDRGLQSKDLIEMSDKMAPDVLKIPEIAGNPNKVIIVMTGIDNKLERDPGRDLTIYVARIRSLLNQHARDRVAFIERAQTTAALQAAEAAGVPQQQRMIAQYALKGVFYQQANVATDYYLCTFQLTTLTGPRAGEIIWENSYEVRTLNY